MSVTRSPYRLLVFDWDGTLEDSAAPIVRNIARILRAVGKVPPADAKLRSIIGLSLTEGLAELYPGEDAHELSRRCRQQASLADERVRESAILFDGVTETLVSLQAQGLWLAVATGKSRTGLDSAINHHRLGSYFLATRCADDARSKPHPEMLLSILDELGVFPAEALMIGDTTYDMHMAQAAGVESVAVTYGVHSLDTLVAAGHSGPCLDDIGQLIPLLTQTAIYRNA